MSWDQYIQGPSRDKCGDHQMPAINTINKTAIPIGMADIMPSNILTIQLPNRTPLHSNAK